MLSTTFHAPGGPSRFLMSCYVPMREKLGKSWVSPVERNWVNEIVGAQVDVCLAIPLPRSTKGLQSTRKLFGNATNAVLSMHLTSSALLCPYHIIEQSYSTLELISEIRQRRNEPNRRKN